MVIHRRVYPWFLSPVINWVQWRLPTGLNPQIFAILSGFRPWRSHTYLPIGADDLIGRPIVGKPHRS